jgi:RNA polymerase sigma-70 factor (sigma-E family)
MNDVREFCQAEYPRLVGILHAQCGDRGTAEELAQETLVRVWANWAKVSTMESPRAWAHRVALNLATSWFRSRAAQRRALARLDARPIELPNTSPDSTAGDDVRRILVEVPERQRTALVLRYYADLSVGEVAIAMGCQPGTVKSLTSQAIARLRARGLEVEGD